MKKYILLFLVAMLCHSFMMANENVTLSPDNMQEGNNLNQYRRSSLCILLVTHQGTKYAEDMERQFLKMKLPERYNEHNILLRVLHTDKSLKAKDIAKLLENNEVGKQLVARWFNRNPYTCAMNMDLIHDRGGYNASMSDAERADMTVRGRALLQEEGVDLIQNTFVLVCDMEYKKRDDAGVWAMLGTAMLSAGLDAMGQVQGVNMSQTTNQLNQAAVELSDLSGFSVMMDAHLLQLKWTPDDLNRLYANYWVDDTTPTAEAQARKNAFDNAAKAFGLEYLGHYKSRSTKIEMQSNYGFDDVILEVTDRTVNKSIKELALMFPQFKPKTPLAHNSNGLVAYVGTKEDVTDKTKFDVVEPVKKDGEIKYNKVGQLRVVPGSVWNNRNIRMDEITDLSSVPGTRLYSKGKDKYSDQPYMLVESGKSRLGGMKKFTFDVGVSIGTIDFSDERSHSVNLQKPLSGSNYYDTRRNYYVYQDDPSGLVYNLDLGCTWNFHKNIGWNIAQMTIGFGSATNLGFNTGLTFRTNPMGSKKNWSLFVMPQVGIRMCFGMPELEVVEVYDRYRKSSNKWVYWYTWENNHTEDASAYNYLDWGAVAGLTFKRISLGLRYGAEGYLGGSLSFHL